MDGNDENEEYANNNGCYYMGKMSALGQGTDKNLFQVEKYFDEACSYGDPRDDYCYNVVSLYERGDEVIGITPKGQRYYYYAEKFCNPPRAYNGDICAELVNLYENGEETLEIAKDSQKVLYYSGMLCERYGIDFFCDKIIPPHEKSCTDGNGESCYKLYQIYKDRDKAKKFLYKACDSKYGWACISIADIYLQAKD